MYNKDVTSPEVYFPVKKEHGKGRVKQMRLKMTDVIIYLTVIILVVGITAFALAAMIGEGVHAAGEHAEVQISVLDGDRQHRTGDIIHLCANVKGTKSRYSLQWQSNDGTGWDSILGAKSVVYAYELNHDTGNSRYRVIVNIDRD